MCVKRESPAKINFASPAEYAIVSYNHVGHDDNALPGASDKIVQRFC